MRDGSTMDDVPRCRICLECASHKTSQSALLLSTPENGSDLVRQHSITSFSFSVFQGSDGPDRRAPHLLLQR